MKGLKKANSVLCLDPIMAKVIEDYTLISEPKCSTVFIDLVRSMVYQQISIKAAASIYAKLEAFLGTPNYFPSDVLEYTTEELRTVGLSSQKANYITNIAHYFMDNSTDDAYWKKHSDEEIIKALTTIKGVGEWTAQMTLMFFFDRPDVFPSKDLGVQVAMKQLYNIKKEKKDLITAMEKISSQWAPYRTFASKYLWAWKREN